MKLHEQICWIILIGLSLPVLSCTRKAGSNAGLCEAGDARCGSLSDLDGDGVLDGEDNCILIHNPDQADLDGDGEGDKCDEDMDGDLIPNLADNCPVDPNPDQSDIDGDGEGNACDDDIDGDEILNDDDNCPEDPNPDQADLDGDGEGDVCDDDIDGDGIPNDDDDYPYCAGLSDVLDLTDPRGLGGRIGDGQSPLTPDEFDEVPFSPCAIVGDVEMIGVERETVEIFQETLQLVGSLSIEQNDELSDVGWPSLILIEGKANKGLVGNLSLENNQSLSSVVFDRLKVVEGNITVFQNQGLEQIWLDRLEEIRGTLSLRANLQLERIQVDSLGEIGGTLSLLNNHQLNSLQAPSLNVIRGNLLIQQNSEPLDDDVVNEMDTNPSWEGLKEVSLPLLSEVFGNVTFEENPRLFRVDMRDLRDVQGHIQVLNHAHLQDINLSALKTVKGNVKIENNFSLKEINLSSLNTITEGSFLFVNNDKVEELDLALLFDVNVDLEIMGNQQLVDINLDELFRVGRKILFNGNFSVEIFHSPKLQSLDELEVRVNPTLQQLLLPSMNENRKIWISNNAGLLRIDFSRLAIMRNGSISANSVLEELDLSSLKSIRTTLQFWGNGTSEEAEPLKLEFPALRHVDAIQIWENTNIKSVHFDVLETNEECGADFERFESCRIDISIGGSGIEMVTFSSLVNANSLRLAGPNLRTIDLEHLRTIKHLEISEANMMDTIVLRSLVKVSSSLEISENDILSVFIADELRSIGPSSPEDWRGNGARVVGLYVYDNPALEFLSFQKLRTIRDHRELIEAPGNAGTGFAVRIVNNPNLILNEEVFIESEEIERNRYVELRRRADALSELRIAGDNPMFQGNHIFNPDYLDEVSYSGHVVVRAGDDAELFNED